MEGRGGTAPSSVACRGACVAAAVESGASTPAGTAQTPEALLRALATAVLTARQSAFPLSAEDGGDEGEGAQTSPAPSLDTEYVFNADDLRVLHDTLRRLVDATHPAGARGGSPRGSNGHRECPYGDVGALTAIESILTLPAFDVAPADAAAAQKRRAPPEPTGQTSLFLFVLKHFELVLLNDVRGAMLMAALIANIGSACSRKHAHVYVSPCGSGGVRSMESPPRQSATASAERGSPSQSVARRPSSADALETAKGTANTPTREGLPKGCGEDGDSKGEAVCESPVGEGAAGTGRAAPPPQEEEERTALRQIRGIRAVVPCVACWEFILAAAQRYKAEQRLLHFLLSVMADIAYMPDTHRTPLSPTAPPSFLSEADCKALVDVVLPAFTEPAVVEVWLTALCNLTALHPRSISFLLKHHIVDVVEKLVLFHGGKRAVVERGLEVLSNLALEVMADTATLANRQPPPQGSTQHA